MAATFSPSTIIGVVGGAASGKDTVAEAFTNHGFEHVSSSDRVREEIAERGLSTSRSLQTQVANEMRAKEGSGYWVHRTLLNLDMPRPVVVSGLYAPGEGEYIQTALAGKVVGVVASLEAELDLATRYRRLIYRADGSRDDITYTEFLAAHSRENSGVDGNETNISKLLELADYTVVNDGSIDVIHQQVEAIAEEIMGAER